MLKRMAVFVLAGSVVAIQGWAGITYTAVTKTEGAKDSEMRNMTVKAWVEGQCTKVVFAQSGNPMFQGGSYMLSKNAGQLVYLVNPGEKTYMQWDMKSMTSAAMQMAQAMMKMTFSSPKVEKLLDEAGPAILGYPTRHYKFRTSYRMEMTMMGTKSSTDIEVEDEIWSSTSLKDPGLTLWGKAEPIKTGNEQLDALAAAEMGKIQGFPLKRITVNTSKNSAGNSMSTRTVMEVTELKEGSVPAATFEVPAGYKEIKLETQSGEGGGFPSMKLMEKQTQEGNRQR